MHILVTLALVTLTGISKSSAESQKVPLVGTCSRDDLESDAGLGLGKLNAANYGVWDFVMVPKYSSYEKAEWMFVDIDDTDKGQVYLATVFLKLPGQAPIQLLRQLASDSTKGKIKAQFYEIQEGISFIADLKIVFLKIVRDRWAFFYVCSKQGEVSNIDFRYVISQGELTSEEIEEIKKLDEKYKFKGKLIAL